MPDTDRPSDASLSDSEADRLSERFTASWDEPDAPDEPVPQPPAADAGASAPKPKLQTLLGISPIVVISQPPAPSQPAAAAEPAPIPTSAPSPAPATAPAAPLVSAAPPPPASSPDASSVARGLTTPSKPYIPKDDPSTPAVVISEAALADAQRRADRARIAQTIPAQTRSAPLAAPA